jgi:alanyl-tRNA synthetase
VVVLGTSTGEIVAAVKKDLTPKVHAGRLASQVAQAAGGKAGGRPDMAEGGAKDPSKLKQALEQAYQAVEAML